ncbi:dynactin p62 family-domain-containing protein [Syncephalastrum racemosum]|uniref:Dynactin subunit 4 n=1 Tax=Syncephalastrum racemosum TaxID=13706 RepID=A0A1X2HM05_SYNRA|nr:dynactin p62 family-domain-containing protein [Syncephalastrum racemosum]
MVSEDPAPFVHYYCACPDNVNLEGDTRRADIDVDTGSHVLSEQAGNYLYPLSRLYFCEDCHQIRCPSCVQDEIVSYYCPNCLFEVPTASVKSEKNRCARNCFQCPICQNTLTVVAAQEQQQQQQILGNAGSAGPGSGGPYFLSCNVCRWNSKEINMTFEKPTSLALQLQKSEEALPDAKEFDHLKEHFEKHLRLNAPPTLPSSFLSFSSASFSKMNQFHHHDAAQQNKLDDVGSYEPSIHIPDDDLKTVDTLISLRDVDPISTLPQRFTQLHNQPYQLNQIHPQRIHLCIKRSKRCRTCRHILIKPEQKAQATRFKIKLVAMNYIPTVSIIKLPRKTWPLQLGIPTQFVLKFTNPLYEEMSIRLATPQIRRKPGEEKPKPTDTKMRGKVTLLSPHFTVGAYNETIEYDDEMYPTRRNPKGLTSSWADGVYEKRNNYTSIIVEVIPEKTGEFKFPLLITYTYKSDDDGRMDVSSGDIDTDDIDDMDTDDGSKKANTSMRLDDDGIKSYSFWCLIGLGNVEDQAH